MIIDNNHIMYLKSHWISETQNILAEEQTIGMFWGQVQILFLIFPNRHTLKFFQMKCNPTDKKLSPNVTSDQ